MESEPLHSNDFEEIKQNNISRQVSDQHISYHKYPVFSYAEPQLEYDKDCSICLDSADPHYINNNNREIAYLACGHIYHYDCLMQWQKTIKNYYFNSIECCVCKQKVSLSGIWQVNGQFTPINTLGHVSNISKPLMRGKRIILRINNRNQHNQTHNNNRRRSRIYIPGFSCCFGR